MIELADPSIIWVDRSRVQARKQCRRKRYYGYHYDGMGLEKEGGKYEADFGQLLHTELSKMLLNGGVVVGTEQLRQSVAEVLKRNGLLEDVDTENEFLIAEQTQLAYFLLSGWQHYRQESLMKAHTVVSTEVEQKIVFDPHEYLPPDLAQIMRPVGLNIRLDAVLRNIEADSLIVLDFKTASRVGHDWEINHENSLQSILYVRAAQRLYPEEYVEGIQYEGLVKGRRELDTARSSPFNGRLIQFGSPLYGWAKGGKPLEKYVAGAQRVCLARNPARRATDPIFALYGHNTKEFFPNTIPFSPLGAMETIGGMIVAENEFANSLTIFNEANPNSPQRKLMEQVLFEKNEDHCFKYGTKHPCAFVDICHKMMEEEEIMLQYQRRMPHHGEDEKGD